MRLPIIEGLIRRRILVNFRVDPEVIQSHLPAKFKPKLHGGHAIAGICLIRLEQIRPKSLPSILGISSENAAHRIAVTWQDDDGADREGVFIPRRDTNSWLNHLTGGRIFPGEHHLSDFRVQSSTAGLDFEMRSRDRALHICLRAAPAATLPTSSAFPTLADASRFFEGGSCGFSVTRDPQRLDGISLRTKLWQVEPLDVTEVRSSYFENPQWFPSGSVQFDCALLMKNVAHEWHSEPDLHL